MGGNVTIGDQEASRIDLKKNRRTDIVSFLIPSLQKINQEVEKISGVPMWSQELFRSLDFLSGSAKHFIDLDLVDDDTFSAVKPSVGDIDTKVPIAMEKMIEDALGKMVGKTFGDLTYIGSKKSAGQIISLWKSKRLGINVQIDFEMVDFENGKPTQWANFSHSSAWEDMQRGVKGVAHKYLQRALSVKSLRSIVILKGKTKKPTVTTSTDLAFSVMKGLRQKLKPVLDKDGKILITDGLETYEEIPTSESEYITSIDLMFKVFFGKMPTSQEEKMMWSSVGICELVKKYWNKQDQEKLLLGVANTLWGKGAQGLYRGDPASDLDEKTAMYEFIRNELKLNPIPEVEKWKQDYYKNYK